MLLCEPRGTRRQLRLALPSLVWRRGPICAHLPTANELHEHVRDRSDGWLRDLTDYRYHFHSGSGHFHKTGSNSAVQVELVADTLHYRIGVQCLVRVLRRALPDYTDALGDTVCELLHDRGVLGLQLVLVR